jgi:hypothetical protein
MPQPWVTPNSQVVVPLAKSVIEARLGIRGEGLASAIGDHKATVAFPAANAVPPRNKAVVLTKASSTLAVAERPSLTGKMVIPLLAPTQLALPRLGRSYSDFTCKTDCLTSYLRSAIKLSKGDTRSFSLQTLFKFRSSTSRCSHSGWSSSLGTQLAPSRRFSSWSSCAVR